MSTHTDLARLMTALQLAQPLDQLQSLYLFKSGRASAIYAGFTLSFNSLGEVSALADYVERRPQPLEGMEGDGI